MHSARYRRIQRLLHDVYFVPPEGSERRLLHRLGLTDGNARSERKFATAFRWALIAAAAFIVVLNIGSVRRSYLQRFRVDGIVAMRRSIDVDALREELLPRDTK